MHIVGKEHRELLAVLRANSARTKLVSTAYLDDVSTFLYALKFARSIQPSRSWELIAEVSMMTYERDPQRRDSGYTTNWEPFFPPKVAAAQLAPDVIELFRDWTIKRAQSFPDTVLLKFGDVEGVRLPAWRAAKAKDASQPTSLKPLATISCRGAAVQAVATECADDHALLASGSIAGNAAVVVRFPRALGEYEVKLSHDTLQQLLDRSIGVQLKIRITDSRTQGAGEKALQILSAELLDLHLLSDKGTLIPE